MKPPLFSESILAYILKSYIQLIIYFNIKLLNNNFILFIEKGQNSANFFDVLPI